MANRDRTDRSRAAATGPTLPTTAVEPAPDPTHPRSGVNIARGTSAPPPTPGRREPAVVGVDPGFGGGLAGLTLGGAVVASTAMPVLKRGGKAELDVPGLVAFFRAIEETHAIRLVVVERVHSMPKQGVASTFSFGRNFGEVLGAVKALAFPLELTLPTAWKKIVLAGTTGDKQAAIAYVTARFPAASLLATARSTKPHDGIADSLCLAEWGRRLILGKGPGV